MTEDRIQRACGPRSSHGLHAVDLRRRILEKGVLGRRCWLYRKK